jgi:GDPmannose 4,6-dehydratase
MASPRALITGITGQDGSYLAEHLLELGYEVHGIVRRSSSFNTARIDHLYRDPHESGVRLFTHYGDLSDPVSLTRLIYELRPDQIYNLGAQSHVAVSFQIPDYTLEITGAGTLRLLDAVRESGVEARVYQAGSSEMFGSTPPPQSESSPLHPRSPYGVAKVAAHWMAVNYREAYGMHVSNGILFNHESPRRGETFVTRKITRAIARIKAGLQEKLYLGNLDAARDWGYAPDFVRAMHLMLQRDEPGDYVLATGEMHTVREFCERAFAHAGLGDFEPYVEIDPRYIRPAEVDALRGDAAKARAELGWRPEVGFERLVEIMVDADIAALEAELAGEVTRYSHEGTG